MRRRRSSWGILATVIGVLLGLLGLVAAPAASAKEFTPPAFTSADHTTFAVGATGSFTVTATGDPTPVLSATGSLPVGVTFTDHADGTASLAGTPETGTGGVYPLTLTASPAPGFSATQGGGPVEQSFTLTVNEPPAFLTPPGASFQVGITRSFTLITDPGQPTAVTITKSGALPSGVTFTDNGDGTATLAGAPVTGTGGSYPLVLTATNAAGHADQDFTVSVWQAPVFTSADHATFHVGQAGAFAVTTTPGYPAQTSMKYKGELPAGVTFTDNGDGTATLAGTPAAGAAGVYDLLFGALPDLPPPPNASTQAIRPTATQPFTLTVVLDPTITAKVSGTPNAAGWYRTAPVVSFTCTPGSAPLTGPCPAPVTLAQGRDRGASRTITATDGGSATATVSGIDVDLTAPTVTVRGATNGAFYPAPLGAPITCTTTDALSGPSGPCRIAVARVSGPASPSYATTWRYTATGRDVAGNTRTVTGTYRVSAITLPAATIGRGGAWQLRAGVRYTVQAAIGGTVAPRYVWARPAGPDRTAAPYQLGGLFHRQPNGAWTTSIGFGRNTPAVSRYWNIGVITPDGRLHVLTVSLTR